MARVSIFRHSSQLQNLTLNGSTCDLPDDNSRPNSTMATDGGSSTMSLLSFTSEDTDTLTFSSQYSNCWSPTSTLSMPDRSVSQQDYRSDRSPTLSPRTIRKKVYANGQYLWWISNLGFFYFTVSPARELLKTVMWKRQFSVMIKRLPTVETTGVVTFPRDPAIYHRRYRCRALPNGVSIAFQWCRNC